MSARTALRGRGRTLIAAGRTTLEGLPLRVRLVATTMALLVIQGSPSDEALLELSRVPRDRLWWRETFVDLLLVRACAIAPEHELDNVGGYRKLATEGANQVFPDQIPVQHRGGFFVYLIQFNHSSFSADQGVCLGHELA